MKINVNDSGNYLERCCRSFRLWFCEMRLRLDLQYSRNFKRFCEKHGYPNLASLEEEYIQKVQGDVAEIQQFRTVVKEKPEIPSGIAIRDRRPVMAIRPGEQI
ncbi:MAG: hypothetical protein JWM68_746 [Verrucomicrobiales bacterium]|nr:hypothetical protein [Verrucomicrobiales bacterium]